MKTHNNRAHPLFKFGTAYYPDYIPQESLTRKSDGSLTALPRSQRIAEDLKRIQQSGIELVRVAEFSWSTVEPKRDDFHFQVFHTFLDHAQALGLKVMMCTPTATPPKWLVDEVPDILPVLPNGQRVSFGSRRHYDFCHPTYRQESQRITQKFVQEFGTHQAVVSWQTDNEWGCHDSTFSYSEAARKKFHRWLQEKYGTIEALNEEWFTCFWSQGYTEFAQIDFPFQSWTDQNPHLQLDTHRFFSDMVQEFQLEQIEIIRKGSPGRDITHNLMTLFKQVCPWRVSRDLDVIGFDHYQMHPEPHPISSAWQFNLMRSLKGKKFLVLEQQPGQVNWQKVNARYTMDWVFLWSLQGFLHGADTLCYFSWQRMYGGAEQYHHGMVPHDVRIAHSDQERLLNTQVKLGKAIQKWGIPEIPTPRKDILCLLSWDSLWSHDITAQSDLYQTTEQVDWVQGFCASLGLGLHFTDCIESSKLQDYKAVILPGHAFELSAKANDVLREFLEEGGQVVSFPRSCMKKENNQMSPLPHNVLAEGGFVYDDYGALKEGEYEVLSSAGNSSSKHIFHQEFYGKVWSEKIRITDTALWKELLTFTDGPFDGASAVIERGFSRGGKWVHIGVCPQVHFDAYRWLANHLGFFCWLKNMNSSKLQLIPFATDNKEMMAVVNFAETEKPLLYQSVKERDVEIFTANINSNTITPPGQEIPSDFPLNIQERRFQNLNRGDTFNIPGRGIALILSQTVNAKG